VCKFNVSLLNSKRNYAGQTDLKIHIEEQNIKHNESNIEDEEHDEDSSLLDTG
jgi:hypothetical protein